MLIRFFFLVFFLQLRPEEINFLKDGFDQLTQGKDSVFAATGKTQRQTDRQTERQMDKITAYLPQRAGQKDR